MSTGYRSSTSHHIACTQLHFNLSPGTLLKCIYKRHVWSVMELSRMQNTISFKYFGRNKYKWFLAPTCIAVTSLAYTIPKFNRRYREYLWHSGVHGEHAHASTHESNNLFQCLIDNSPQTNSYIIVQKHGTSGWCHSHDAQCASVLLPYLYIY